MSLVNGMFIPPPDIRVRIIGTLARTALYVNPRNNGKVASTPMGAVYDDQWFYIVPGTGSQAGKYRIKAVSTNQAIFMQTSGNLGVVSWNDKDWADQYFYLESGTGFNAGMCRITCPASGKVLFTRIAQPQTGIVNSNEASADHYVSFFAEDMVVDSIKFMTDQAKILETSPLTLAMATGRNKTTDAQVDTVILTGEYETESNFQSEIGAKLSGTVEGSVGVPFVAEGKVSVTAEISGALRWGSAERKKSTWSKQLQVNVGPEKSYKAYASATQSKMDVPFTVTFKSQTTGATMSTSGLWKGVSVYGFDTQWEYTK